MSSRVGPEVSGLQGPLSASPGSFRGTFSSTSVILLMESGWGRNGALWAARKGALQLPKGSGARPGQTKRRVDSFSVSRGPTGAEETGGTGLWNHREVNAGSATRKLRPEGRPARPKRPPQAHPGSSSRGKPTALKFQAPHLLHGDQPPLRSRAGSCAPLDWGRTTAAGQRGATAVQGRPARTPAAAPWWESPGFERKPPPVSGATGRGTCRPPPPSLVEAAG